MTNNASLKTKNFRKLSRNVSKKLKHFVKNKKFRRNQKKIKGCRMKRLGKKPQLLKKEDRNRKKLIVRRERLSRQQIVKERRMRERKEKQLKSEFVSQKRLNKREYRKNNWKKKGSKAQLNYSKRTDMHFRILMISIVSLALMKTMTFLRITNR